MRERECYVGAGNGHTGEFLHYVLEFHIVALQELTAGGSVVKQIADRKVGAHRRRHGGSLDSGSPVYHHLGGGFIFRAAGTESNFRYGSDTGQSLTAEAVGEDVFEIGRRAYFGSCVTLEAEHGIGGTHPAAVVDNLDECAPGVGDYYIHLGGTGIHGVLKKLLYNGRRPLDHLAGGYHVRQTGRQYFQASHPTASNRI